MTKKKIIALVCIFVGSALIGYAASMAISWKIDSDATNNAVSELSKKAITEKEEIVSAEPDSGVEVKETVLEVNFNELKKANKDAFAWIEIPGTEISYPIVHTSDNDFYLKHSFDKSNNSAGWVFADYRNKEDFSDNNTIIYAHGRLDGTMFGSLRDAYNNKFFKNNKLIRIYTPSGRLEYEVVSAYLIDPVSDYLYIDFVSDKDWLSFISQMIKRDTAGVHGMMSARDKMITLSTCYSSSKRLVVHAKLVI